MIGLPGMIRLPPAREAGVYAVALVCLGNICRSPTAHVVLAHRVAQAGLAPAVTVSSCGTAGWHVGKPMDPRSAATLSEAGYDPSHHRARQFDASWLDAHDLVLAMDGQNLAEVHALGGRAPQVRLLGDFDPVDPGAEVPDPYYGGTDGFHDVLAMVERASDALVAAFIELPGVLAEGEAVEADSP